MRNDPLSRPGTRFPVGATILRPVSNISTGDAGVPARHFQLRRCLGVGGFSEVYLATMTSSSGVSSDVAVKMLHANLDPRSQAVQRLRDEGRLLGMLQHPAILQIHDLVFLEGRVALVTEYVPGKDLDRCIAGGDPLGLRGALEVIARVADALDTAWTFPTQDGAGTLELMHRDIKPSNIRVGQHGQVKLLDFGIAKAADADREAKTRTSMVFGSFMYMAPERFEDGQDAQTSDVYSLGCTLFECATGTRLFHGVSTKQHYLYALNHTEHDRFRETRADALAHLPEGLATLIRDMTDYDPARRPPMAEVCARAEALADAVSGPRLRQWAKTHDWTDAVKTDGPLEGRILLEDTMGHTSTTEGSTSFTFLVDDLQRPKEPAPTPASARSRLPVAAMAFLLVGVAALAFLGLNGLGTSQPQAEPTAAEAAAAPADMGVHDPTPEPSPAPAVAPVPVQQPNPTHSTDTPQPSGSTAAPPPVTRTVQPTSGDSPSATGQVLVTGHADQVWLIDAQGTRHAPGDLPAGTYDVVAVFPNIPGEQTSDPIDVLAGEQLTLTCRSGYFKCTAN